MKTKTAAALNIKRLYHYQTFDKPERLARIFTERTIYFSSPGGFNDPWDCRPYFTMWAHYGNSCKGLCLEFSVQNPLFCGALPIEYLDHYPPLSVGDSDEDANLRPLLTKSSVWKYEDEFRVICSESPFVFPGVPTTKDGFLPLPQGALRSVIVGSLMPESDRDLVRLLVQQSGWDIMLKVASLVPNRYAFDIRIFE